MKQLAPIALALTLTGNVVFAQTGEVTARAAPALAAYDSKMVNNGLWQREGLTPRDRSIITIATLIARGQTELMGAEFERALTNGVTPAELSEIITHLAFYSGWGNAHAAAIIAAPIYDARGIDADTLPGADITPLPLNVEAEAAREANVQAQHAETSPGVVDYTRDALFNDLWLRSDLAPRDRSLVTVSALVANGQVAQVTYHLGRAMDNGLTRDEASEALTQMAFYAGWPNVFSAMPVFRALFDARSS